MAKRKRLGPAQDGPSPGGAAPLPGYVPKPPLGSIEPPVPAAFSAPIARVAADAATSAALEEVSAELARARAEGRMIQALPLEAVVADHLVRDRIAVEDEDLQSLLASLRLRGQQTPVEVEALGQGRFGLISGWRRLTALKRLREETGDPRFATVQAIERRPSEASEAYVAMVEENEIRVGLSYYERARIAARAVEQGVYPGTKAALQSLFASASRAKRSKIGSFLALVEQLDGALHFPAQIGERLGLALSQALEADPGLGARLAAALAEARPGTAAAEQALLRQGMQARGGRGWGEEADSGEVLEAVDDASDSAASREICPGVVLEMTEGQGEARLILSGPGVTVELHDRLAAWLRGKG